MKEVVYLVVFLALVAFLGAGVTGYVKNIVKLTQCDFQAPYKAEIIRTAGLLPPIGIVVGWLEIEDGQKP